MTLPNDATNQNLSFTRDNRHQYLETAMVSTSDSEREMMEAEARGRELRARDAALKRRIQSIGKILALVLVIIGIAGTAFWVSR